jgi:hypothetical protein
MHGDDFRFTGGWTDRNVRSSMTGSIGSYPAPEHTFRRRDFSALFSPDLFFIVVKNSKKRLAFFAAW